MEIRGYPWISLDMHGYPWIAMYIHVYPWKSMDIHVYPWMSMEIHGNPWAYVGPRPGMNEYPIAAVTVSIPPSERILRDLQF